MLCRLAAIAAFLGAFPGVAAGESCPSGVCTIADGQTNLEITLQPNDSQVRVNFGSWRCYGSDLPTQEVRAVIRLFQEAERGFVRISLDGAPAQFVWNGPKIATLPAAIRDVQQFRRFALPIQNPDAFVAVAKAVASASDPATLFEENSQTRGLVSRLTEVVIEAPLGDPRTRVFDGCYAEQDLKALVAARQAAARDFLVKSGNPPTIRTELPE